MLSRPKGRTINEDQLAARLLLLAFVLMPAVVRAQVPVFAVTPGTSTIKFGVKASVPITGNFDKWDATLTFKSADVSTGVLDIKIQAASVNTGSGMKNDKLKSKDFFDVDQEPADHVQVNEHRPEGSGHV